LYDFWRFVSRRHSIPFPVSCPDPLLLSMGEPAARSPRIHTAFGEGYGQASQRCRGSREGVQRLVFASVSEVATARTPASVVVASASYTIGHRERLTIPASVLSRKELSRRRLPGTCCLVKSRKPGISTRDAQSRS